MISFKTTEWTALSDKITVDPEKVYLISCSSNWAFHQGSEPDDEYTGIISGFGRPKKYQDTSSPLWVRPLSGVAEFCIEELL